MKEAHYVASNIPIFLKNAEFVYSVDNINPLSGGEMIFGQGGDQKYKIIKFRFAPKLPSFCINQKCSMEIVGTLHIVYSLNLNGGLRASPQRLATLGIYYQKNQLLGLFQLNSN